MKNLLIAFLFICQVGVGQSVVDSFPKFFNELVLKEVEANQYDWTFSDISPNRAPSVRVKPSIKPIQVIAEGLSTNRNTTFDPLLTFSGNVGWFQKDEVTFISMPTEDRNSNTINFVTIIDGVRLDINVPNIEAYNQFVKTVSRE